MNDLSEAPVPRSRGEPVFNIPGIVVVVSAILLGIHAIRQVVPSELDEEVVLRFSFIPLRYGTGGFARALFADDPYARWWSPLTYGLLHGDWQHVSINVLWLVVFGSAVAWRFGAWRFVVFSALCSVAGAGAHYLAHVGEAVPVVGASAAISGLTAAACRFVFESGAPLGGFRPSGSGAFRRPALPFLRSLANPRVLAFVVLWFVLTIVFGAAIVPAGLEEGSGIAWEAHIGGFVMGLLLFPVFDPIRHMPSRETDGVEL